MRVLTLLLSILCLPTMPVWASLPIETWETDNGAKVMFMASRSLPMVDARVTFNAGSARDGDLPGLAKLTNSVLVEGAGGVPGQRLFARLENVGANFSNGSYRDMALLGVRVLSNAATLKEGTDVIASMLKEPDFPQDAVDRDRASLLSGVRSRAESARAIASEVLYATLYKDHPYGHPSGGTEASLKAITRQDLIDFHRRYYVANNAVVAIVGDLDLPAAKALAEKLVGGLPAGEAAAWLKPPKPDLSQKTIHIPFPGTQSHVYIAGIGVAHGDPDRMPLAVGNHLLGGNGLVSLLSEKVRGELGLTYSVSSRFSPMGGPGPFLIGLTTRADQVDDSLKAVHGVLDQFLDQPMDAEQIAETKQNLTGGFALGIASNGQLLDQLSSIGFYDYPTDWLDSYIDRVKVITPERVQDAFRRKVERDKLVTIIVGPKE